VNYILDTHVISELVAPRPNPKVIAWIQSIDPNQVFLSVIAIGELKKGIDKLPDSGRKEILDQWLREDLLIRFENRLLSIDTETMLVWGKLVAQLETSRHPMSAIDSLISATAAQWQFTLMTRNIAHFDKTGILLLNPWEYSFDHTMSIETY
jgi:predicted nucleic acid-binding protein